MNTLLLLAALAAPGDTLDWSFGDAPSLTLDWSFGVAAIVSVQPPPPPPTSAATLKKVGDTDFAKEVFDETGVPYSLAPWLEAMRTPGVPYFDPPRPLPAPTAGGPLNRQFGVTWNGLVGGVDNVPNDGTAPRGTLLWVKQDAGNERVYAICLSQGPEGLAPRAAARQPAYSQPNYQPVYSLPHYSQPVFGQPGCPGGLCPSR